MRRLNKLAIVIALAFASGRFSLGQNTAASVSGKLPEFEVVSLKSSDPNGRYLVGVQLTQDQLTMNLTTLKELISVAYAIPYWELSTGEPWMAPAFGDARNHFDLTAKLPQDGAAYNLHHGNYDIADDRIRRMLQAMLAERFQLKFHRETKTGRVSILERSGKPLMLVPSTSQRTFGDIGAAGGKGWGLYNASMSQLADLLSVRILHHPVFDKTGLEGNYDFRSATIMTDEDFKEGNVTNMLIPAVKEMGLKLTETTGPVETFVIDHAEPPTAN